MKLTLSDMSSETDLDFKIDLEFTQMIIYFQKCVASSKTWVTSGISEIPNTGDYKTAMIGKNPVIVARATDETIHVMINECR